ncbi:MAG TPA: CoA ester lyase [Streptomyces sp.]|uniref:HpcH/HpaI aldolase/citrate lyase family protein n=1 Tax=Streptomyces sp. TaxID=1931 RepID=UPI002B95B495|nr:CoA ester lyase [Streptomyces sp.]HWU11535.1 CoA ester lyase [Streptomyces sp.]
MTASIPRSHLYVPGNAGARLGKAWASDADAVIIDLEDAVPPAEKPAARRAVADWLASTAGQRSGTNRELWVRVNAGTEGLTDVETLAGAAGLTGLVPAKATVADLRSLAAELDRRGLDWRLSPLLETPGAVLDARVVAGLPRVLRLQIGEYDLCAATGIQPGASEAETAWARSWVVFASSEAGIEPPVGPVSTVVRDEAVFTASTERAARQGFVGRACIHPAQLPAVHAVFTPTPEAVARAAALLSAYDAAIAAGSGAYIDETGHMVDEALARGARRIVALARR